MDLGESSQPKSPPHVLVASAFLSDRVKIVAEFERLSWTVTEANTVEKALRILGSENSDATRNKQNKMEIDMVCIHPSDRLEGEDLYDRITSSRSTMNLPIVVLLEDVDDLTKYRFTTVKWAVVIDKMPFTMNDVVRLRAMMSLPDKVQKSDDDSDG